MLAIKNVQVHEGLEAAEKESGRADLFQNRGSDLRASVQETRIGNHRTRSG